jgi:hypothetical protein
MEDTVTCLVRGPASRYPRGYVWLLPAWLALAACAVVIVGDHASGQIPLWLAISEIGGLLVACATVMCVLLTVRRRAFRADKHGIWLGVRTERKRPKLRQIYLPWPEIAQLRVVPRHYGAQLEITLGPSARIVHRPGLARRALRLLGSLIMPVGFGRGRPALTAPRTDPPRYLVKICDLNAKELGRALAPFKPEGLAFRLLVKKGALRFTIPAPRPPARQLPGPAKPAKMRVPAQPSIPLMQAPGQPAAAVSRAQADIPAEPPGPAKPDNPPAPAPQAQPETPQAPGARTALGRQPASPVGK